VRVRTRFDQLAKGILGKVLADVGEVRLQEEIAGEVQAADVLFLPAVERASERARLGLLGRMADSPCLLEPFHDTPGVDAILDCLCKQLTLRRKLLREARKNEAPAAQIPRLWILSSGRPETALAGLGFTACEDLSAGVWQAAPLLSMFVVSLRDLPATRDTLALRLLGTDLTFLRAFKELDALPENAWEQQALMPLLLAFRREITQNSEEDEMSYASEIEAIYDKWDREVRQRSRKQGVRAALVASYETRFGALPDALRAALDATEDEHTLLAWVPLFTAAPAEDIVTAVLGVAV
jgi:hypothetical protein